MMFSEEYDIQGKAPDFQLLLHRSKSENHWPRFIEGNNSEAERGKITWSRQHRWLM